MSPTPVVALERNSAPKVAESTARRTKNVVIVIPSLVVLFLSAEEILELHAERLR